MMSKEFSLSALVTKFSDFNALFSAETEIYPEIMKRAFSETIMTK